jgi:hypothetical protein
MIFIAVMCLAILLGPASINIFLAKLLRVSHPFFWDFTIADFLVFFSAISLFRNRHECRINNLPFLSLVSRFS